MFPKNNMAKRISLSIFALILSSSFLFAGTFTVTFLDCGQGDAIVLKTPQHKTYLIDAGPNEEEFGGTFDAGKKVVAPYLYASRTEEIEAVLISHPHLDHYGGAFAVIRSFSVKELEDAGTATTSATYGRFLKEAELRGIKHHVVKAGDRLDWDPELKVEVLWPSNEAPADIPEKPSEKKAKRRKENLNDQSVVLKITHGSNTFLFPGDAEKGPEEVLVQTLGHNLQSKVLKVPHHGSRTSSTEDFLDAVNPQLAVISCGRRNKFKHPHSETLDKLESRNATIYRTDQDGTVEITSDGKELTLKTVAPRPDLK